jgi:hypothetical protein
MAVRLKSTKVGWLAVALHGIHAKFYENHSFAQTLSVRKTHTYMNMMHNKPLFPHMKMKCGLKALSTSTKASLPLLLLSMVKESICEVTSLPLKMGCPAA